MSGARLRIVLVSYHSEADLARCLPTLAAAAHQEIVVVDNASSAATKGLLETDFPHVRYLDAGGNLGFARANNLGAAGFAGDYLGFLNPDTEVDEGALHTLCDFLDAHPQAAVAGPFVRNPDGSRQMSYRHWPGFSTALFHRYSLLTRLWPTNPWSRHYLMSDDEGTTARPVDWLSACGIVCRRSAIESVGGFDERYFMFCEDTALCKTLALAGWERWYVPQAAMTHHIGRSVGERSVRLVYLRHRSMWIYFTTFNRWWPLLAPLTLAGLTARFCLYALRACVKRH